MKKIKLYGELGERFGKEHKFDVRTPAEAVKALSANFPDFRAYLSDNKSVGYRVITSSEQTVNTLHYPADSGTIKFIPEIVGAGGDSTTNIILGIILIVVAWWNPLGWGVIGSSAGELAVGELVVQGMFAVGTSLVLSGVSSMLYSPPVLDTANTVEQNAGSYFNGPANTNQQGSPVQLIYGRLIVGSQVISAGIRTEKIAL